jgi:ABC-type transporter Mla subunit MlaD
MSKQQVIKALQFLANQLEAYAEKFDQEADNTAKKAENIDALSQMLAQLFAEKSKEAAKKQEEKLRQSAQKCRELAASLRDVIANPDVSTQLLAYELNKAQERLSMLLESLQGLGEAAKLFLSRIMDKLAQEIQKRTSNQDQDDKPPQSGAFFPGGNLRSKSKPNKPRRDHDSKCDGKCAGRCADVKKCSGSCSGSCSSSDQSDNNATDDDFEPTCA